MKTNYLSILAILGSLTAVAFTFAPDSSSSSAGEAVVQISELTARLDRLESRLTSRSSTGGIDTSGSSSFDSVRMSAHSDRVAELQARQDQLEKQLDEYGIIERFATHQQLVEQSYEIAQDANRPAEDRFEALSLLREEGRVDAAVVDSIMDLWDESSRDEELGPYHRWAFMEHLRGSTAPRFRDAILSMLSDQPEAKMTDQAISALEPMSQDPAVEEWLVYLASSSSEEKIRQSAASVLQRRAEPNK